MSAEDLVGLAEIRAILSHMEKDDLNFVNRSLWLYDQIPSVKNKSTYDDYGRKVELITTAAQLKGIDTKSMGWFRSQEGVLATTYGARQIEWEEALRRGDT